MAKVHLLMKKEEIDEEKMKDKVAVVFDVLLATSTIAAGLHFGAKEVIPVLNGARALQEAQARNKGEYILVGEHEGITIEGFHDPLPLYLQNNIQGKSMFLSTTNGTVAITRCVRANKVYMASLLNGKAVAEMIKQNHPEETIIIVCSGSSGAFCMEDFYGAGYFLDELLTEEYDWDLSDASLSALLFYRNAMDQGKGILGASRVGKQLQRISEANLEFVANRGIIRIVPYLTREGSIIAWQSSKHTI
ncbi:MAG: 2-phosphosulfolactate phosphatase [Bacillus sp. (in: firmicutes)]